MLPNQVDSSTTSNPLEVVDHVHTAYTPRFPQYIVKGSIKTASQSMPAKVVILGTINGYIIIRHSSLPLNWRLHGFSDVGIPPVCEFD